MASISIVQQAVDNINIYEQVDNSNQQPTEANTTDNNDEIPSAAASVDARKNAEDCAKKNFAEDDETKPDNDRDSSK